MVDYTLLDLLSRSMSSTKNYACRAIRLNRRKHTRRVSVTKKGNGIGTWPERYVERKDETERLKIVTTTTSKSSGARIGKTGARKRREIKETRSVIYHALEKLFLKTEGNLQRGKYKITGENNNG